MIIEKVILEEKDKVSFIKISDRLTKTSIYQDSLKFYIKASDAYEVSVALTIEQIKNPEILPKLKNWVHAFNECQKNIENALAYTEDDKDDVFENDFVNNENNFDDIVENNKLYLVFFKKAKEILLNYYNSLDDSSKLLIEIGGD